MICSNAFQKYSLIYLEKERIWVSSKACVWTNSTKVGGLFGISAIFHDLRNFFVETLAVEKLAVATPNVETYIKQLLLLVDEASPQIADIKTLISAISALTPTRVSLGALANVKCLPTLAVGGTIELMRPSEEFFIADRREYESAFRGKVPILDFKLEEIHDIHFLLAAFGLQNRYMSVAVQEVTMHDERSDKVSAALSQTLRAKSKALYR